METTVNFTMRMPRDFKDQATRVAEADKRSLSNLIMKLLDDHCQAWEARQKEAAD